MRVILHSDLNNFYASVECRDNPALNGHPVAVCGDPEARHGIVLAKNGLAKGYGVMTGEAIREAKKKCPGLLIVKPDARKYLAVSRAVRRLYYDYTDRVEPFGLDEAWLELTAGGVTLSQGSRIADAIRERVYREQGVTCSVGVADNKVFAKLGSDMKKPNATTLITPENVRDSVWRLPASELLYVGKATKAKLARYGILTIGDLALFDRVALRALLGVWGDTLWEYANGLDPSPVNRLGEEAAIQSIGNSTTTPRDLVCEEDARRVFWSLCEQVASRLREHHFHAHVVSIYVRDNALGVFERQKRVKEPVRLASKLMPVVMELLRQSYSWERPIRSLGVRTSELVSADRPVQLSLFDDPMEPRLYELECAIDRIRGAYGHESLLRAAMLSADCVQKKSVEEIMVPPAFGERFTLPA